MEFENIKKTLRDDLTKERYEHSLSVAEVAVKLAAVYGADESDACLAGILHDCAKCLDINTQREFAEKMNADGEYL